MNRLLGAILLVSGMSIGTGMLALPVVTSFAGFYPTLLLLFVCWIFMVMTGMMLVDVTIYAGKNSNLITMSNKTLGQGGKAISWFCYLFLFYSLQAAHIAAAAPIFQAWLPKLPSFLFPLGLTLVFGGFIYAGTKAIDVVNRFVIIGLALGLTYLIIFLPPHIDLQRLTHMDFKPLLLNIPIVLLSFGFQNIVPTLVSYLESNRRRILLAITIGSFLPLFLYAFWEFVVLGVVPLRGQGGLIESYLHGASAAASLMHILKESTVQTGTSLFSFCTILASFLGIGIALIDFLMDGLKLPKNHQGRAFSFFLAFFLPTTFVYFYPEGFLYALKFAGILAVILVGILPCLMVLKLPASSPWSTPQGRIISILTLTFFLLAAAIMLLLKLGFFLKILAPYLI